MNTPRPAAYIAWERQPERTLPRAPTPGPASVLIGPEGGFIPYEVEKLNEAGCGTVSMGPRILRVENAVAALVTRMST